jgi:rod shape-determining protein MreC
MSLRDSQFGELKVPLTWTAAVALIVAAVIAIALLLTDRRETFRAEAYGAARGAADSVLSPVGDALSAPGRWTGAGIDAVRGYFFAVSENHRLKGELRDMRQWRDVALALKNENNRYRSLLGLKTDPPIPMVAARVVTDSRGPFADTRIANTGREAGVNVGNPVMSEYGLVGRVIGVTAGASRVLMLTDVASRTPVMIDRTNARAILTGDSGPNPRLDYLRGQYPVREGDRVLTSGDGGIVPRGLPVGVAVKGLDGKWRVVLASDKGPVDFVRILLFQDFTELVNRKELDQLPVPPPSAGLPPMNVVVQPPAPAQAVQPGATAGAAQTPAAGAAKPAAPAPTAAVAAKPAASGVAGAPKPAVPAATAAAKPVSSARPALAAGATSAPKPAGDHAAKPAAAPTAKSALAKPAELRPAAKSPAATDTPVPPKPKAKPADLEEPPL